MKFFRSGDVLWKSHWQWQNIGFSKMQWEHYFFSKSRLVPIVIYKTHCHVLLTNMLK